MKYLGKLAAGIVVMSSSGALAQTDAPKRPNVLVIVADDLGYSDLGAYGGEISTPNLDRLAKLGVRLTNFHASPTCSPSRAMLLSGTDNHTAGVGAMAEVNALRHGQNAQVPWGYEGVLTNRVATLAERIRQGGYHTAFSGKWHLGMGLEQNPAARGFDSSFALLQGGHNHFGSGFGPKTFIHADATYTLNGKLVNVPANFYSSDDFTTRLIEQLSVRPARKPFFAYLAFTAPHSPLQAPAEDIARYKGRYDTGWAVLRQQRIERMKSKGIVPTDIVPSAIDGYAEAWNRLTPEQKKTESRKMEIFAAMVDRMDQNIGRLVAYLKRTGELKNTIILFTSDNGPAAEGAELYRNFPGMPEFMASRDNRYEAMGSKQSLIFLGTNWALAAAAPYRLYKGVMTEGGTRVPAFVYGPVPAQRGAINGAYADVMDVAPTVLDLASVVVEPVVNGREVAPIRGRSMRPYLMGVSRQVHPDDQAIVIELHGQRAVRQGKWKLMLLPPPYGDSKWALYDLSLDPAELRDISAQFPERVRVLQEAWQRFAAETRLQP